MLVQRSDYEVVELLPGEHKIAWGAEFGVSVMVNPAGRVAAIVPLTGSAAERGLANAILDAMADEGARGPLRIAVMAAEASGDPFVSYEGAPITMGRDADVGEMVERLANLEDDVVIGTTRRGEVRERLGVPLASHPALRVEIYRLTALARREIRPLFAVGDVDWAAREERFYAGYLLVVYDEAEAVVDVGSAFVAAATEAPETSGPFDSESRSAYEYVFEPSAEVSVAGFRLAVESGKTGTIEALYTEPGDGVVYQNGSWAAPPTH